MITTMMTMLSVVVVDDDDDEMVLVVPLKTPFSMFLVGYFVPYIETY